MTQEMRECIYKYGGDVAKLRGIAEGLGMWNMRASGWRKVLQGLTTPEEVLSVTVGAE
jgi:type II secretory ATPase GspE/PulE/Tfp pilus assembly ATPase PilB-like protein